MPKAPASEQPDAGEELTLTDYCAALSRTDKRVELIGGFSAAETKAGRIKDTEAGFNARFLAFCNKPV